MRCSTENPLAILFDVIIFSTVVVLLSLVEWGLVTPFKTIGFYCKDPKLSYVNSGETVSVKLLLTVSFVLPYFMFLFVERFTNTNSEERPAKHLWLEKTHHWYLKYLHGLCFTFLITDLAKYLFGEPRPHFLHTCLPRESLNCTVGQYFDHYECTNNLSRHQLVDSFKSFPSGHAAFSCYFAVYFLVYFTRQIRTSSHLFLNVLQFFCIFWALLCSLSRITDHRHHWWDVLSGGILGISVATYFISYNRRYKEKKEDLEYPNAVLEKNKNHKFNLISDSNS